jgi:hypothetical protein
MTPRSPLADLSQVAPRERRQAANLAQSLTPACRPSGAERTYRPPLVGTFPAREQTGLASRVNRCRASLPAPLPLLGISLPGQSVGRLIRTQALGGLP